MKRLDDSANPIGAIYQDLLAKYKELEDLGKGLDTSPRVAVVGHADTAPTELLTALFGEPAGSAEHQPDAGEAWQVAATFNLDSLPGRGVVGAAGSEEQALSYLREADAVVVCLLRDRLPTAVEQALCDHVKRLRRGLVVVVVTPYTAGPAAQPRQGEAEADHWTEWHLEVRRVLNDHDATVVRVRRLKDADLVKVGQTLHDKLDKGLRLKLLAMLRHDPTRGALVRSLIHARARTAAFLGMNPIPYADIVAIAPVQLVMVCQVAGTYGRKITARAARDFITASAATLTAGAGFRALFRRVKKRLGTPGLPVEMGLGAVIAWTGTLLIGYAAKAYYQAGGELSIRAAVKVAADEVAQTLPGSLVL